jgi:Kef-type K+ transport system membrane component KefB
MIDFAVESAIPGDGSISQSVEFWAEGQIEKKVNGKMDVNNVIYSTFGYIGVFILECAYILVLYDTSSPDTQAGVMIILAAEAAFMLRDSKANVEQKRADGRVSKISRIYTTVAGIALLALMAMSANMFRLGKIVPLWILLFVLTLYAKIMWERHHRFQSISDA